MWVNPHFNADMFTFTKEILNGKVHFCALVCASKKLQNYRKEENNFFFEKLCCFFIRNFWNSPCNLQIFFTARCLDVRFWKLLYFICLNFNSEYIYLHKQLSRGGLRKRCSENMQQIYRRTHMPKCDFNKVSLQI